MRWFKIAQADPRLFGEGEDPTLVGSPQVQIVGDVLPTSLTVPGIQGVIDIPFTLQDVKSSLEQMQGGQVFSDITLVKIEPIAGKFGYVDSRHPHTIHLNEQAVLETIQQAIEQEVRIAQSKGIEPAITPDVNKKVQYEVAKKLAGVLLHERAHAEDFQRELKNIIMTGKGSVSSVPEAHGPEAEKGAEGLRWKGYRP